MAIAYSVLKAIWHMLSTGEVYGDLGGDCCQSIDRVRLIRANIYEPQKSGIDTQSTEKQLEALLDTLTWIEQQP